MHASLCTAAPAKRVGSAEVAELTKLFENTFRGDPHYKPGVRDVRESPALRIIGDLAAQGALVEYCHPLVPQVRLSDGTVMSSSAQPGDHDAGVVHTVHDVFPHEWLEACRAVIDTTYRLGGAYGAVAR